MKQISDSLKKEIKDAYDRLHEMGPEEKAEFLKKVKELRQQGNGPDLFENDISDQLHLARTIGFKFPENK